MSLAKATIYLGANANDHTATVYGIGKSAGGKGYVTLQTAFFKLYGGPFWLDSPVSFDGRSPASFGKPYTVDGVEYVRVYNAPPPTGHQTQNILENNLAHAKEAERRALEHLQGVRIATRARLDEAQVAFNEAVAKTEAAKRAMKGCARVVTHDPKPRSVADLKRDYDDARRGADAAKATYNQVKNAYSCAVEHLAKAETALYDAQKYPPDHANMRCYIDVDGIEG